METEFRFKFAIFGIDWNILSRPAVSRRGTIVIIIILVAAMAVLGYYLQQQKRAYVTSPYKSVPLDAALLIEAVDLPELFESLTGENDIIANMMLIPGLKSFASSVLYIDSLVHIRDYRTILSNNPVLISIHLLGKDRLTPYFTCAVPPEIKERHIKELLGGIKGYRLSEKDYQGTNVYELHSTQEGSVYISFSKGILSVSPGQLLIETGIRQVDLNVSIKDIPGFTEVSEAAGKRDNKIFLIYSNLQRIIALMTSGTGSYFAADAGQLASCTEADIFFSKDGFSLNGYTEVSDSAMILYSYTSQESGSSDIYRYLPSGVAMFETISSIHSGSSDEEAGGELRYLADVLKPNLTGEATRFYLDMQGQEIDNNKLLILPLRGRNAVEKAFADEIDQLWEKYQGASGEKLVIYQPDDETSYNIYRIPSEGLGKQLAGSFGSFTGSTYATFYDDLFVLGSATGSLTKFIYDNMLSRTLANDLTYRDFESTMPSRSGYYFYCVPSKILPLLKGILKDNIVKGLESDIESLRKIQAVGYQLVSSNDMIYNTLSVKYISDVREEAKAVWESLLDTVAGTKPMFFRNHYTGRNEIFMQDLYNNIYLINSAGRILWKRPISEQIRGRAYTVDYYKNDKLQILFATENFLHMIDRNGNDVEKYPVRLRSSATNGLALFDYENNKDYRLFICGDDRIVYAYDKSGSTVRGWEQFKTSSKVLNEVEFFRVSGKDYLVVNDETNMYILDRRGNPRVNLKEQVERSVNSTLRLTSGSTPGLVLAARDGSIKNISFSGEVKTYTPGEFGEDPVFEYFDIDADGSGEYIFIDGSRMHVYDNDHRRMFVRGLESENITDPTGLVFSSGDRKLGYLDRDNDRIFIIDDQGKIVKGFPLNGSTSFSVGKLDHGSGFNLITGGRDSFLYNYEITR